MRFGVLGRFTPLADPTLAAIVGRAQQRGHDVVVLDIAHLISGPVEFSPTTGRLTLGDVRLDLDSLEALWLGPLPSASARLASDDVTLRAADFDVLLKRQAARHALGWSIALCAEARGVRVLSSPSRARPFDHKPFQMAALHAAGIAVADTVVTDHSTDDDDGDVSDVSWIVKPVIGGPVIRIADHVHVGGAPVLRQPRLDGRQLRVAVVGGVVVAAAAIDIADQVIDSRTSASPWQAVPVDAALADIAVRCARVCAFDVCAIDLVETATGRVVLDVNRTPQLMDLAALCDVDIAGAVVSLLERARPSAGVDIERHPEGDAEEREPF